MRETALFVVLRTAILARLANRGVAIEFRQSQQPTTQGIPEAPCLFGHVIHNRRYGWPQRIDRWNEALGVFEHGESVQMETTIQFSAQASRSVTDLTAPTPTDYLAALAMALQSDALMRELRAAGVGVLRIRDIRTGYTTSDRDRASPDPSFDAVFTHRDETLEQVKPIEAFDLNITRV